MKNNPVIRCDLRSYAAAVAMAGFLGLAAGITQAAEPATPSLDTLANYLRGHWQCSGHFANGKPISSIETFEPILDGKWLLETHHDLPPNKYDAYSIWGVDAQSHRFTVDIHDNFGGLRNFYVRDLNSMTTQLETASPGKFREVFMYIRKTPDWMRITYERSADGRPPRLGDTVACSRAPAIAAPGAVTNPD